MSKQLRKRPILSARMQLLKENLDTLRFEKKSLLEQVHEGSKLANLILTGINRVFSVIAAFLTSFKEIPIIGSIIEGIASIPYAITYITDPTRSIKEKLLSGALLLVVVALAITAFALGTVTSLIFGLATASVFFIMEGYWLGNRIFNKYQSSKDYAQQKEFMDLVQERKIPEGNEFDERFEVRAVQLQHEISTFNLSKKRKDKLQDELDFINGVLGKKNIITGSNPENDASQLSQLYIIQKEQIDALAEVVSLVTAETVLEGHCEVLDEIQKLQKEILVTETDITGIIQPVQSLKYENELATAKLALALPNFATAGIGVGISIVALLIGLGTIAAPPIFLPVGIGLSIGLAVISLGKWIAEKLTEQEDKEYRDKQEGYLKDIILDEALISYEKSTYPTQSGTLGNSSHTKHMQELLTDTQTPKEKSVAPESAPVSQKDGFTLLTRKKEQSEPVVESIYLPTATII